MAETQAAVPATLRGTSGYLEALVVSPSLLVQPPKEVVANGLAMEDRETDSVRYLQNIGDEAVGVIIAGPGAAVPNVDISPNNTNAHFILAAASADGAGDGGQIDLSRFKGDVYVGSVSGAHKVLTFQASFR